MTTKTPIIGRRDRQSRSFKGKGKVDAKEARRVRVKLERLRMSLRKKHKKGYYNIRNLELMAWKGQGSETDPVRIL